MLDTAEMEAYDKIKMVPRSHGVAACGVLHRWLTDVSVLGLAEQARTLTRPAPPKRDEDLAEHAEMWQDKIRRLEAHGVLKINALRMLMAGKARSASTCGRRTATTRTRRSRARSC